MSIPIRIVIVDDHTKVHRGLSAIFNAFDDLELVGQCSNGEEAVELCYELQPDIVIMDVIMPVMDGIEATTIIKKQSPDIKILALSSFQDDDSVRAMIQAGANGYILKNSTIDNIAETIRATYSGTSTFSPEVTQALFEKPKSQPKHDYGLTARDQEVLAH